MVKQQGTAILIFFLLALLVGWWSLPEEHTKPYTAAPTQPKETLPIKHTSASTTHTYSGELPMVRDCDSFSTKIETAHKESLHATLSFVITTSHACDTKTAPASFAVSLASQGAIPPTIDHVLLNGNPVAFRIIEAQP